MKIQKGNIYNYQVKICLENVDLEQIKMIEGNYGVNFRPLSNSEWIIESGTFSWIIDTLEILKKIDNGEAI